jgi:hypothetical protein
MALFRSPLRDPHEPAPDPAGRRGTPRRSGARPGRARPLRRRGGALPPGAAPRPPKNVGVKLGLAEVRKRQRQDRRRTAPEPPRDWCASSSGAAIDAAHFLGLAHLYAEKGEHAGPSSAWRSPPPRTGQPRHAQAPRPGPLPPPELRRAPPRSWRRRSCTTPSTGRPPSSWGGPGTSAARASRRRSGPRSTPSSSSTRGTGRGRAAAPAHPDPEADPGLGPRAHPGVPRAPGAVHTAFDRLEWHRERFLEEEGLSPRACPRPPRPPARAPGQIELAARLRRIPPWSSFTDEQVFRLTRVSRGAPRARQRPLRLPRPGPGPLPPGGGAGRRRAPHPLRHLHPGRDPAGRAVRRGELHQPAGALGRRRGGEPSRLLRLDAEALDRLVEELTRTSAVQLYWSFWRSLARSCGPPTSSSRASSPATPGGERWRSACAAAPKPGAEDGATAVKVEPSTRSASSASRASPAASS